MFFGRETIPTAPQPTQWQYGPVIIGPTPGVMRTTALSAVSSMTDRGFTTDEMLAEAEKVYRWLLGEKGNDRPSE